MWYLLNAVIVSAIYLPVETEGLKIRRATLRDFPSMLLLKRSFEAMIEYIMVMRYIHAWNVKLAS
ncbi:hypothetical protein EON65_04245 [archaeon]|nr:MAG: hypothetical protein EON65_04245 [archaeon]